MASILIIEPDSRALHSLAAALTAGGHHVRMSRTFEIAREYVLHAKSNAQPFDAICLNTGTHVPLEAQATPVPDLLRQLPCCQTVPVYTNETSAWNSDDILRALASQPISLAQERLKRQKRHSVR